SISHLFLAPILIARPSGSSRVAVRIGFRHTRSGKLSVERLTWQPLCEAILCLEQRIEIDAGIEIHRLQHEDEVLGRDVAGRSGSMRTAAETAKRRIERTDAAVKRGDDVGEPGAAGIVEMGAVKARSDLCLDLAE